MSEEAKAKARSLGIADPAIVPVPLKEGAGFVTKGKTSEGLPFEISYTIENISKSAFAIRIDGKAGGAIYRGNRIIIDKLKVNTPIFPSRAFALPGIPANLAIAVIQPRTSELPQIGEKVAFAVGMVRDTVPPPSPPPPGK